MKRALIIPGWEQDCREARYASVAAAFEEAGFEARSYDPTWGARKMAVWTDELLAQLPDSAEVTLLGFSLGAMIALMAAARVEVKNLILCSPSGYFYEYAPLLTPEDTEWARANVPEFTELSAVDAMRAARVENGFVLAGEKELALWPEFQQWVDDLSTAKGWPVTVVPGAEHEIGDAEYQKQILGLIRSLSDTTR
jgi:pimeloyl-ACP methyl ester carboxylesterase